ncbi:MAG TPA: hypothetical protein VMZ28_30820 [Kofleriaceae bacterium]|nr:hypothetical protein [Kofleriaceae bacterium]
MQELLQLIAVLSSLSDFGVSPNPKAAPPAELIRYGMDDADVFVYFDVEAVVPRNVNAFVALVDKPEVAKAPELRAQLKHVVEQMQMARAGAKLTSGIDPVTDVKSIAAWVKLEGEQPQVVVVARGNFPPDAADLLGKLAAGPFKVVRTADGQLVGGTPALIDARVAKGWKRARRDETAALAGRPILALRASPSARALEILSHMHEQRHGAPLGAIVRSMVEATAAVRHNGVSWSYAAKDRDAVETVALGSDGVIHLMRAAHLFARGAARVLLAGLRAHAGDDPRVAAVLAHETELLALADGWSGDGRFVAVIDRAPAKNRVTVRATGKKLSHVLPLGGLLPLAGAAAFLALRDGAPAPAEASVAAPAAARGATGRPLDVGGAYRRAKQKRGAR